MEIIIVSFIASLLVATMLVGAYIVGSCDDEPNINRRKMWFVVFLFGPGAWLGGGLIALVYKADDHAHRVAEWFRSKQ